MVPLPDGRQIAVRTFGDPDGFCVVDCHGGLVSGADIAPAAPVARDLGIRLVAPNRPGVGASGRLPERRVADWPNDVAHVCDSLGIERFGVIGWSMGGQYALACGAALADRVTAVACVAGCVPLGDPAVLAELSTMDKRFTWMACRAPVPARAVFSATRSVARVSPRAFTRATARGLSAADRPHLLGAPHWFAAMAAEGLSQAGGAVDEYRAFAGPWGFDLTDVAVPVHVWQGTDDHYVPWHWGERIAAQLPDAALHIVEGAGHFVAYDRWAGVLGPLLP